MAMTMHVDIVSAQESIYSGRAEMLVAPGTIGDLGIAPGHAPLLTRLAPGPIKLVLPSNKSEIYYLSGGMLEVQPGTVTVLADSAVRADDLDEAKAIEAKAKAELAIKDRGANFDYHKAQAELIRALAELRTIKQLRESLKR